MGFSNAGPPSHYSRHCASTPASTCSHLLPHSLFPPRGWLLLCPEPSGKPLSESKPRLSPCPQVSCTWMSHRTFPHVVPVTTVLQPATLGPLHLQYLCASSLRPCPVLLLLREASLDSPGSTRMPCLVLPAITEKVRGVTTEHTHFFVLRVPVRRHVARTRAALLTLHTFAGGQRERRSVSSTPAAQRGNGCLSHCGLIEEWGLF